MELLGDYNFYPMEQTLWLLWILVWFFRWFREHFHNVEWNDKNASKPVTRHFHLLNHSKQHMAVYSLSLHLGSSESRKTQEQKFIFQIDTLNPHGINKHFSFN